MTDGKWYTRSEFWAAIIATAVPILEQQVGGGVPWYSVLGLVAYIATRGAYKAVSVFKNGNK